MRRFARVSSALESALSITKSLTDRCEADAAAWSLAFAERETRTSSFSVRPSVEVARYLRAVPHRPALPARLEKFLAFLWQIAPNWPVLPTSPGYKSFAVIKTPVARHLHTVEVAGSNPAAPTMKLITWRLLFGSVGSIW